MTIVDETNTDAKVGIKGKRSKWKFEFAIPDTKNHILITVNKGGRLLDTIPKFYANLHEETILF